MASLPAARTWALTALIAFPLCAALCRAESDAVAESLDELLAEIAPRIWFHPEERWGPSDPRDFVRESSLWYRDPPARELRLAPRGEVDPKELGALSSGKYRAAARNPGAFRPSLFISPASAAPVTRPGEAGGLGDGQGFYLHHEGREEATSEEMRSLSGRVPLLWRLGPNSADLRAPEPDQKRRLVEFWYHSPYNHATGVGLGNHQGDWEGFSLLVDSRGATHSVRAAYLSAHEGGSWICASALPKGPDGKLELYSALGTHATYAQEGTPRRFPASDSTARGFAWETWKALRALVDEPYYGYSGAWGSIGPFAFMHGPMPPAPGLKTIPRSRGGASDWLPPDVVRRCGLNRTAFR